MRRQAKDLLDIVVNGKVITITKNHPVLTIRDKNKEWIPAGGLVVGDLIVSVPHGKLV
jgi:intein/homing endonuclease